MREILEEAMAHAEDGDDKARQHARRNMPRRFYGEAVAGPVDGGFAVMLDGRPARTPGRKPAIVNSEALAEVMAAEWAAQDEFIDVATMPVVRLVNSALEGIETGSQLLVDEIVKYAGNDLLLYRAESPRELAAEQERVWDAALVGLAHHLSVSFQPTVGILHQPQPEASLRRIRMVLEGLDSVRLAALVSITGLTGSGLLAVGLLLGLFEPQFAWDAAHLDEDYQARVWGEDSEALERRKVRRAEFDAALTVLAKGG